MPISRFVEPPVLQSMISIRISFPQFSYADIPRIVHPPLARFR